MRPVVTLVGAGPATPSCSRSKAVRALRRATVALVDDLVDPGVLRWLPRQARVVHVGKRGGCRSTPQDFIERLMVAKRCAASVVRVGRRPFCLRPRWRGNRRAAAPGIEVEVVGGLTAGIAARRQWASPVTDRRHAQGVVLVTATRNPAYANPTGPRWPGAASRSSFTWAWRGLVHIRAGAGRRLEWPRYPAALVSAAHAAPAPMRSARWPRCRPWPRAWRARRWWWWRGGCFRGRGGADLTAAAGGH